MAFLGHAQDELPDLCVSHAVMHAVCTFSQFRGAGDGGGIPVLHTIPGRSGVLERHTRLALLRRTADYSGTAAGALDFACACRTLPAGAMGLDERQRSTVVVLAEELEPALAGVRPRLLDGNA